MTIINFQQKRVEKQIASMRYKNGLDTNETKLLISMLAAMKQHAGIQVEDVAVNFELKPLFNQNTEAFEDVFCSIALFWGVTLEQHEIPVNREFEMFQTFSDLFCFFANKLSA